MLIATRNLTDKDLNGFERKILKNVQKYGWHANGIPGEGSSPIGLIALVSSRNMVSPS